MLLQLAKITFNDHLACHLNIKLQDIEILIEKKKVENTIKK